MSSEGERIAALEATLNGVEKYLKENLDQLRRMHTDHYISQRDHDKKLVEIEGLTMANDRHIRGHMDSHWKWICLTVTIVIGAATIVVKIIEK